MSSTIRMWRPVVWCFTIGLLVATACGGPAQVSRSTDIDDAVEVFLSGRHGEAIEAFSALLAETPSMLERREIYYYLGRAYLESGDVARAADAFTAGVQLGDTGPCLEYLQRLRGRIEGGADSVSRSPQLTRLQLCALVDRWVAAGEGRDPDPDPIAALERRGWLERLPDGGAHADAPVSTAALHVFLSRMCAEIDCTSNRHGAYPLSDGTVTGRELVNLLGRVMPWPVPDGR